MQDNWLLTILEQYIKLRNEKRPVVLKTGQIHRSVCEACFSSNYKQFAEELTDGEKKIAQDLVNKIIKYKIASVSRQNDGLLQIASLISLKSLWSSRYLVSNDVWESVDVDSVGNKIYHYYVRPAVKELNDVLPYRLFTDFERGYALCEHFKGRPVDELKSASPLAILLDVNIIDYNESQILNAATTARRTVRLIYLACQSCRDEALKRACPSAFKFMDYAYQNMNCRWEAALLATMINRTGRTTKSVGGDYAPVIVIEPERAVIIFFSKYTSQDLVNSIQPSMIVMFGSKKDTIPYLKHGVDLICVYGDNIIYYDSKKRRSDKIEEITASIIKNLEIYAEKEKGNDHSKYIAAMAKIGSEFGYFPETEKAVKGSRVDCVWLDNSGGVFGAIEVEFTGGIKKDIITTWELEPKVSVILTMLKTDKVILDLTEYMILKSMPHPLIVVNIQTKTLYYFDKEKIVRQENLFSPYQDSGTITVV